MKGLAAVVAGLALWPVWARAETVEEFYKRTPLTMYEDWDLFRRMWDRGAQLVHVPQAVYCAHGEQRNVAGNWQSVYDAIWADHEKRVAVPA